jgi:hypothetical protein
MNNLPMWVGTEKISTDKTLNEIDDQILMLTLIRKHMNDEMSASDLAKELEMLGIAGAKRSLQYMIESNAPQDQIEYVKGKIQEAENRILEK